MMEEMLRRVEWYQEWSDTW